MSNLARLVRDMNRIYALVHQKGETMNEITCEGDAMREIEREEEHTETFYQAGAPGEPDVVITKPAPICSRCGGKAETSYQGTRCRTCDPFWFQKCPTCIALRHYCAC